MNYRAFLLILFLSTGALQAAAPSFTERDDCEDGLSTTYSVLQMVLEEIREASKELGPKDTTGTLVKFDAFINQFEKIQIPVEQMQLTPNQYTLQKPGAVTQNYKVIDPNYGLPTRNNPQAMAEFLCGTSILLLSGNDVLNNNVQVQNLVGFKIVPELRMLQKYAYGLSVVIKTHFIPLDAELGLKLYRDISRLYYGINRILQYPDMQPVLKYQDYRAN